MKLLAPLGAILLCFKAMDVAAGSPAKRALGLLHERRSTTNATAVAVSAART